MGYRLELSQAMINLMQYGRQERRLPPAEFFLAKFFPSLNGSVYTFCMCPGGTVVPASSSAEELVLNGMSDYRRNGAFGNAALVVSYNPDLWHNNPAEGIEIQRAIERVSYQAGGGGHCAPAATVKAFVNRRIEDHLPETSYPRGVRPWPVWEIYENRYDFFRDALLEFDRKMKGLVSDKCLLIAPETRTSSPVRITRGTDGMSVNTRNLYPCGEGAGYAGGIITSAIDGLKAADNIITGAE